jgi:hypothetical protein
MADAKAGVVAINKAPRWLAYLAVAAMRVQKKNHRG